MAKEAVLHIRMDADIKKQVEELYKNLGTSFAEAVRIMAKKSLLQKGMPFSLAMPDEKEIQSRLGLMTGKWPALDDIDQDNEEIALMFERGGL